MTQERKEPTLTGIVPSAQEVAPAGARSPASSSAATKANKVCKRPAPVSARQIHKPSPLLPLALILALTGMGLAGFAYWQLLKAQQQMSSAEMRILDLEKRLSLSDDESTQSVTVLQASLRETQADLKMSQTEVRKLWDTRNVNRKGISDNKSRIASVSKTASSASGTASSAHKLAQAQEQNWKALSGDVMAQSEQLSVVSGLSEGQQKRVRKLADKVNRLESRLSSLKSDLVSRVRTNEEAIEAIDAYRLTVNRNLRELKHKLSAPAPVPAARP